MMIPLVGIRKGGDSVPDGKGKLRVKNGPVGKAFPLAVGKPPKLGKPIEGSAAKSASEGVLSSSRRLKVLIGEDPVVDEVVVENWLGNFRDVFFCRYFCDE
jgi:hypothetical protein